MSVQDWAAEEVRLAKESTCDADPRCSGYDIALRAYQTIFEGDGQGLSGCGFSFVRSVLKDLLDELPLTPIYDEPGVWSMITEDDDVVEFQCRRRHSLFKRVDKKTGEVTFHDIDRVVCTSGGLKEHTGFTGKFTNGFITRLIEDKFPIQMPYMPTKQYVVQMCDFATNGNVGEFDTMFAKSVLKPDGKIEKLNWYFKETPDGFVNIDEKEYLARYQEYLANFASKHNFGSES